MHTLRVRQTASHCGPGTVRAGGGINTGLIGDVDRVGGVRVDPGRPSGYLRNVSADVSPKGSAVGRSVNLPIRRVKRIDDRDNRIAGTVVRVDVEFVNPAANRQAVLRPRRSVVRGGPDLAGGCEGSAGGEVNGIAARYHRYGIDRISAGAGVSSPAGSRTG